MAKTKTQRAIENAKSWLESHGTGQGANEPIYPYCAGYPFITRGELALIVKAAEKARAR